MTTNDQNKNRSVIEDALDIREALHFPWWKPAWFEVGYEPLGPDYIPPVKFDIPIWTLTMPMWVITLVFCHMAVLRLFAYIHLYRIVNYGTVGDRILLLLVMYIITGALFYGTST